MRSRWPWPRSTSAPTARAAGQHVQRPGAGHRHDRAHADGRAGRHPDRRSRVPAAHRPLAGDRGRDAVRHTAVGGHAVRDLAGHRRGSRAGLHAVGVRHRPPAVRDDGRSVCQHRDTGRRPACAAVGHGPLMQRVDAAEHPLSDGWPVRARPSGADPEPARVPYRLGDVGGVHQQLRRDTPRFRQVPPNRPLSATAILQPANSFVGSMLPLPAPTITRS
jgi:hypothetical protein